MSHHTNDDCTKADGTTCGKCKRNHHSSLHNEKKEDPSKSNLDPEAPTFNNRKSPDQAESKNNSVQGRDNEGANNVQNVLGVCPVQKIKVRDSEGNFKTLIAMLDTGSNTSLFSKRAEKLRGLSGPQTHLTMNLAGGQKRGEVVEVLEIVTESLGVPSTYENLQHMPGGTGLCKFSRMR